MMNTMNVDNIKMNRTKMIFQFAVPSIIAMVLTSLITVVDGFFIGNYVGPDGIAAVNLGLPIIYLYLAVGLMISVGGVAIAGISFGEGDRTKCNHVFNQTIVTTTVFSWLLSLIMWLSFDLILHVLKADAQVAMYFKQYYSVMLFQLPLMVINASFGMFIRGEGNPQYFMKVNILNVLMNTILDYLFIKWFHWGTGGIAVASLLSAIATLLCILHYFMKKSKVYRLGRFQYSAEVSRNTFLNGSSEFIGEMSSCISMFAYNFVIMRNIGTDGVTAFAIAGYIGYIFSMIIIGFGQGALPLISFTFGAREYQLSSGLRRVTNKIVFIAGAGVYLLVLLTSGWYRNLFVKNEIIGQMVQTGIRIFTISFLFSGINSITSFYFTAIGKALESAVISAARGFVILLICIFSLPVLLGMTGVWLVAPITEIITLLISILYIYKDTKYVH